VQVVAFPRAVARIIIITVDLQCGKFSDGHLSNLGHEVIWSATGVFADAT
jgi:hypothetical protein